MISHILSHQTNTHKLVIQLVNAFSYCITQLRDLEMEKRDPRTVVAVILGGGAGTRLFPLTKRRAKPAVSLSLFTIIINYVLPGSHLLSVKFCEQPYT